MKQRPPESSQRGYTLLELLIVVALLATMVSLAVPSLRKFSQKGQLRNAARQLRAELLAARLEAIESAGCMYFCYQPGNASYRISRSVAIPAGSELLSSAFLGETAGDAANADAALDAEQSPQTLASGIRFVSEFGGEEVPAAESMLPGSESGQWAGPLVFYPNGRALNARFRLASERYWIDLTIRGLTGTVRMSPVHRFADSEEPSTAGIPEAVP